MMKCLFDLSYIRYNLYAGVSKYAYRILDYLVKSGRTEEFTLLLNTVSEKQIREWYPQFKYEVIGSKPLGRFPIIRTLLLTHRFQKMANKGNYDVVFCPWGNEISCLKLRTKKVSVIHDLQLRIDLKGVNLWIHEIIDDLVVRNSNNIVTISEFSKQQIKGFYPFLSEKQLVALGNSVAMPPSDGECVIKGKYILYVGRICKMKNIVTLVKAYAIKHSELKDYKLVIVGQKNEYWYNVVMPIIEKNKIEEYVEVKENCSEKELSCLYRGADLFVFPSLREGFGSPPLEASLECTPVLSTTCDSLKEVLMNKVYTYQDPTDANELSDKMIEILSNPPSRNSLEKVRQVFLDRYSIETFGEKVYDFLSKISK